MTCFIYSLIAYLFGSVLFGVVTAKFLNIQNLREKGSGNIGATNIARVSGSKALGILVALLDGIKGALPVVIARYYNMNDFSLAYIGASAVLGHIFPIWHKWRGGKGVATFIGMNFALDWKIGILLGLSWLITFALKGISSLSSLVMLLTCVTAHFFFEREQILPIILISLLIILKHKGNIVRLIKGTEVTLK